MHPILVVDDEQAIAMLIRRILTDAGYRCEAVTDSIKAADLLEKKQYDLVLLDIMMPQIDGYDLLNYIRPTGTPCIFITAKAADLTVDTAACRIQRGDEEIRLTPKEYELLLLFLRNRGRALYRDYLYETVWGEDDIADSTRTLDTHVTRLRRKLHLGDRLRTVRNVGYMLEKE